jgi:hypothetical protein
MTTTVVAGATTSSENRLRPRISISFNFVLALMMAAVVIYGFSHTIGDNLLYPSIPRPGLLYVHAAVFSSWIALYILQTSLVASRNVALHRRLGAAWIAVGTAMPIVGVTTGIAMRRFHILHDHETATFIAVILWDMAAFSTLFLLAVLWRKRPEYHRRFMFLATCGLTDAGFGRFPVLAPLWSNANFWSDFGVLYVGVDALVLIAVTRDLVVQRRVHVVYKVALPLIVTGQLLACVLSEHPPALWTTLSRELVGVG